MNCLFFAISRGVACSLSEITGFPVVIRIRVFLIFYFGKGWGAHSGWWRLFYEVWISHEVSQQIFLKDEFE